MGVKLEDLLNENKGPLLEDKSKKTINLLLIAIAIVVFLIIVFIGIAISNSAKNAQIERARQLSLDINLISATIKNIYSDYRLTGDNSKMIGISQEGERVEPVTLNINGHTEEFKYGYYYLTGEEVRSLVPDIRYVENYVLNYSTGDAVNLSGVKWNGKVYYSVDDISAIRDGVTPPSDYVIYISSPEDMQKLHDNPNGQFRLTRDIDMSTAYGTGDGWKPVPEFSGTFDGRGYIISNLIVSRASERYCGLFGQVKSSASINNLKLQNAQISGGEYTGAIAGACSGNVSNCIISGNVSSQSSNVGGAFGLFENGLVQNVVSTVSVVGNQNVGGLVGDVTSGTIEASSSDGSVNGSSNVGGIVGRVAPLSDVLLSQLYANVNLIGVQNAGGAIGSVEIQNSSTLEVINSYVNGRITSATNNVAGFVGNVTTTIRSTIRFEDVYTTVDTPNDANLRGGFAGNVIINGSPIFLHCFWEKDNLLDKDVNEVGYINNQGAYFESYTPEKMRSTTTYGNWDVEVWKFVDGSLPTLRWQ